jgi:hypothetical protein
MYNIYIYTTKWSYKALKYFYLKKIKGNVLNFLYAIINIALNNENILNTFYLFSRWLEGVKEDDLPVYICYMFYYIKHTLTFCSLISRLVLFQFNFQSIKMTSFMFFTFEIRRIISVWETNRKTHIYPISKQQLKLQSYAL